MHFDTEALLAYRDKELTPGRMKSVEQHLTGCDGCRQEMRQLEYELDLFLSLPGANVTSKDPSLDRALEEMLVGIHKWRSEASNCGSGSQLLSGVATQLAEYLGGRGAAGVVESVRCCCRVV